MSESKKWKWHGKNRFNPETATKEETEEYIKASEEMLARVMAAKEKVIALLENKQLWEDLQVVAFNLNDALDEMRDLIYEMEDKFRSLKLRPGWTHLSDGEALVWNGAIFIVDGPNGLTQLTSAGKDRRIQAVGRIPDLYEELVRPRLLEPLPALEKPGYGRRNRVRETSPE